MASSCWQRHLVLVVVVVVVVVVMMVIMDMATALAAALDQDDPVAVVGVGFSPLFGEANMHGAVRRRARRPADAEPLLRLRLHLQPLLPPRLLQRRRHPAQGPHRRSRRRLLCMLCYCIISRPSRLQFFSLFSSAVSIFFLLLFLAKLKLKFQCQSVRCTFSVNQQYFYFIINQQIVIFQTSEQACMCQTVIIALLGIPSSITDKFLALHRRPLVACCVARFPFHSSL